MKCGHLADMLPTCQVLRHPATCVENLRPPRRLSVLRLYLMRLRGKRFSHHQLQLSEARSFLEGYLSRRNNVLPSDRSLDSFYSVTGREIRAAGGAPLLRQFGDSWIKLLQAVYPEHNWNRWEFKTLPRGSLRHASGRKQFLTHIQETHLGHKDSPLDVWYKVSAVQLAQLRVTSMLRLYYGGSLHSALKDLFPEHNWLGWNFSCAPRGFWSAADNRRQFFDWAALQFPANSSCTRLLFNYFPLFIAYLLCADLVRSGGIGAVVFDNNRGGQSPRRFWSACQALPELPEGGAARCVSSSSMGPKPV